MKQLLNEMKWFLEQKLYVIAVALTAVCAYGFSIAQPIIGIDDTAIDLYMADGLAVVMGRWTIFLLNKIFHMSDYSPFMMELVGVIMLCISVVLFCVLLKRIFGDRIGIVGYTLFSCIFISNPIMSELYVYYLHNGGDLAYILTALALLLFLDALEYSGKKKLWYLTAGMLLLWVATGCYESMMILYIVGVIAILFLRGLTGKDKLTAKYVIGNLALAAIQVVVGIALRSLMISFVTWAFDLYELLNLKDRRSLLEMTVLFSEGGLDTVLMLIKRYWVVYFVNAVVYLPALGNLLTAIILGITSVVAAFKKKNPWFVILYGGILFAPFLLAILETRVPYYRSCQFLPFFTALGMLLLYLFVTEQKKVKWLRYVCVGLLVVLIYNQSATMNRAFYTDYRKYESTKEVLTEIAYDVERQYGNDIPVVFTGYYSVPASLVEDYYVSYSSWQYQLIAGITDLVDEHLKEKYFTYNGYSFIGEANFPFIQWGFDAFDKTNGQMMKFLAMHGHSFSTVTDLDVLAEARAIGETMPEWPAEGSITMQDGYILVNL